MIDMATVTGVSIEAWKCNLLPFLEIMIERPTNSPTDRQTDGYTSINNNNNSYNSNSN